MHKNVVAYSLPSKKSYSGPPVVFRWWLFCFELTSTEVLPCHRDAGCDVIHLISRLFRLVAVVSALLPDIGPLKLHQVKHEGIFPQDRSLTSIRPDAEYAFQRDEVYTDPDFCQDRKRQRMNSSH